MIDTLQALANMPSNREILDSSSTSFVSILDYAYKIAMVLIAIFNALFAVYIYRSNSKMNRTSKDADRRITLLKVLILDYNLKFFYESFISLERSLFYLKTKDCDRSSVEKNIQIDFRKLNENFIFFLDAVDSKLYKSMLELCDSCRDEIINNIGDEGVNLWVSDKYKNLIEKPLNKAKKDMLNILFNYKGE